MNGFIQFQDNPEPNIWGHPFYVSSEDLEGFKVSVTKNKDGRNMIGIEYKYQDLHVGASNFHGPLSLKIGRQRVKCRLGRGPLDLP